VGYCCPGASSRRPRLAWPSEPLDRRGILERAQLRKGAQNRSAFFAMRISFRSTRSTGSES
jgi:hypothetical protein